MAFFLSCLAWIGIRALFHSASFGGDIIRNLIGLTPLLVVAALPTALFVVAGVLVSPSKGRKVAFVFFALSLLCSGGGMGMVEAYQQNILPFWLASAVGLVLGALLGLFVILKIQNRRKKKPAA
ncbi:MAG TPA: hypothetical protein VL357_12070 [Rariglobus sp.]|nr:hypothetical protein [Rariglobus sp.]